MANLSFKKVPEELVWRLKIAAFRAETRFGAYCVGLLDTMVPRDEVGTGKGSDAVLGASGVAVKGSAVRSSRKGTAPPRSAGVALVEKKAVVEMPSVKDEATEFNVDDNFEIEDEPKAVEEAVEAKPVRKPRTTCPWCGSPTKPWTATNVQCTVCKRNSSPFIEE